MIFDVVIIGAGAAGLFCASVAGQRGLRVLLLDHHEKIAEKIRISGGGRCNFTNREVTPAQFISANPHFCRSALARYTPQHFTALLQRYGVSFHEKHKGQLFCDNRADDVIQVLLAECKAGQVTHWQPCRVNDLHYRTSSVYQVMTDQGIIETPQVVIATGGLSIPKIGATDFGHRIARQFNLGLVEPRPGLVPLTVETHVWAPMASLTGLSLPVDITHRTPSGKIVSFSEDLLFTHQGLSGPAALQISSYWRRGENLGVDLSPGKNLNHLLKQAKTDTKKHVNNVLSSLLPHRLADVWLENSPGLQRSISEVSDKALSDLAGRLSHWQITPSGTQGYKKAEVTVGGVDTCDLSSQTMESKQPGLYFIGEVVDVTGWLGGYNFQWAWASGFACAQSLRRYDR